MVKHAMLCVVMVAAACGSKPKTEDTSRGTPIQGDGPKFADTSGNMVPPEQAEEVNKALARKQNIVSHCLPQAVDAGEAKKISHGKVTLEIVFAPGGNVSDVKILSLVPESKILGDCIIGHVKETSVPGISKRYETSYTYAFEAM